MARRLQPAPKILARETQAYGTVYTESATFRLPAIDQLAINPTTSAYLQFGIEYATGQIDWEQSDEVPFSAGTNTNYGTDGELAAFNVFRIRAASIAGTAQIVANYNGR